MENVLNARIILKNVQNAETLVTNQIIPNVNVETGLIYKIKYARTVIPHVPLVRL